MKKEEEARTAFAGNVYAGMRAQWECKKNDIDFFPLSPHFSEEIEKVSDPPI